MSRAWPFGHDDLEPFYGQVERLFDVHGSTDEDPTEPEHSEPYPYPALAHEPTIERFAQSLRRRGCIRSTPPNAMNVTSQADRDAIATADGCPDNTGMKSEAENKVIRPALKSERVNLMVRTEVTRLLTSSDGRRIVAAEARHHDRIIRINLSKVLVAAGAVNSAALLLRSATKDRTHSLGNSSVRAVTCGFSGALLD